MTAAAVLVCSQGFGGGFPAARTVVAAAPLTVYASVGGIGVFRSSGLDGLWQGPGNLPSDALVLASGGPLHWRDIFAGLQGGVSISRDGGSSWSQPRPRGRTVTALWVDPRAENPIVAGTERGIYRSDDGGATWSQSDGISGTVAAIAGSSNASALYAATNGRVWISTTGGLHWSPLGRVLTPRLSIFGLAETQAITVFAATSQGLWSQNGGVWTPIHGLPDEPFSAVAAVSGHVIAGASNEPVVFVSSDDGATWTRHEVDGLTGGITSLATDMTQAGVIAAGDSGGKVGFSADSGATWSAPVGGVAGTVGNPVLALALVQRIPLKSDGVPDPRRPGTRWFPAWGGHTIRGAFLTYWLSIPDAPNTIGYPVSEEFVDARFPNATAQYFERMELLSRGGAIAPAPLGLDQAPQAEIMTATVPVVDPHFADFWAKHGGDAFFGPPITPSFSQTNGDGTGRSYLVQYFRNARLEYHPEISDSTARVQVGLLGDQTLQNLGWTQT